MECPNCRKVFVEERAGKFRCEADGWFEKVDDEWRVCEAPAAPSGDESGAALSKAKPQDGASAVEAAASCSDPSVERTAENLEPGPQPPEPDGPQPSEPDGPQPPEPDPKVRKILGGLITITEVDE